jgi:hypothetical protein
MLILWNFPMWPMWNKLQLFSFVEQIAEIRVILPFVQINTCNGFIVMHFLWISMTSLGLGQKLGPDGKVLFFLWKKDIIYCENYVLYCCVLIGNCFATIDCPDCEPCDCEECFSGNNNQGKCHIINLLLFPMHVFVLSSLHV